MFKEEFEFFIRNQERLVKAHEGKVLAIKGHEVLGVYDTPLEAYLATQRDHPLGSFMLQTCSPGPEAYTMSIN